MCVCKSVCDRKRESESESQGHVHYAKLLKRERYPERKLTPNHRRNCLQKSHCMVLKKGGWGHDKWKKEKFSAAMCLSSTLTIRSRLSFVDSSVPPLFLFSAVIWFLEIRVLSRWVTDSCLCLNECGVGKKRFWWIMLLSLLHPLLYQAPIINSHTYLQHYFQRR